MFHVFTFLLGIQIKDDPELRRLMNINAAMEMQGLRRVVTQLPKKLMANQVPDTPYPLRDAPTDIKQKALLSPCLLLPHYFVVRV